jgi:cytochrome c556
LSRLKEISKIQKNSKKFRKKIPKNSEKTLTNPKRIPKNSIDFKLKKSKGALH